MRVDFCIIGAGIVGLATAHAIITRKPGASVLVLDKEARLGAHQTGRNSGVIHSGIYYAPGSLKAKLCRDGAQRTKEFCTAHGIPFENRGKLIVATQARDLPRMQALYERAQVNGITVERLSATEIRAREPAVTGLGALFVPAAAIVSYTAILEALATQIAAEGGQVQLGTSPRAIHETGGGVVIETDQATITAGHLIACAGLQSDRIARMAGVAINHRIVPFRGEYFRLSPARAGLVDAMIYPVPDPDLPFLGVHLTPMIDGSISVGPNAMLGLAREGYAKGAINLRDLTDMARFPGFWRAMARNIGPGLTELGNSLFKRRYLAACQQYCPDLRLDDLHPMPAGIRAQAVLRDGTMVHDFLFAQTKRMLHVCNAPSPAATSALPIGDMIADKVL